VHYKVSVSFLEVYNENIRDLLNDSEEFLDLREDPIKGIQFIFIFVSIAAIDLIVDHVIKTVYSVTLTNVTRYDIIRSSSGWYKGDRN
jgi:hypothetical protein